MRRVVMKMVAPAKQDMHLRIAVNVTFKTLTTEVVSI